MNGTQANMVIQQHKDVRPMSEKVLPHKGHKDYKEDFNTEAILYGNEFHEAAEDYVSEKTNELDPRFDFAQGALDKLKNMQGEKLCEYKMGLTENLEACGFFSDNVWYRGVADLIIINRDTGVAKVIDYKTGKSAKYADKGQLELMALCVFKHFPEIKVVKSGLLLWYAMRSLRKRIL